MPGNPDVTLLSAWAGQSPAWLEKTITNHREYARAHNYNHVFLGSDDWNGFQPLKHPSFDDYAWIKVEAILGALEDTEFVFWVDADSVFVDMKKSLSDVLPRGTKSLTFTGDANDLCNSGHLIFRHTEFSKHFVQDWLKLRDLPFPPIETSMQSAQGLVGDQVALNYLLAGGLSEPNQVRRLGARLFNSVNGWPGNPYRRHRRFSRTHAPTSQLGALRARALVSPSLRRHVRIVPQHRLNAYPWWGPEEKQVNKRGPIVHFVGPWKEQLYTFGDEKIEEWSKFQSE